MSVKVRLAVLLALLSATQSADAWGWRHGGAVSYSYYYYPTTAYYVPVYSFDFSYAYPTYAAPAPVHCAPAAPVYATPTAAPPSAPVTTTSPPTTTPPPVTPQKPAVNETRSYFDAYAVAGRQGQVASPQQCNVGFWNNTTQELALKVNGQNRRLMPGKGLTINLPRQFVWQIGRRTPQQERIPDKEMGLEIVIRR